MILERGSNILIVHRRLFDTDRPRFFVGKVEEYENTIARVSGVTWIQDSFHGKVIKKEGLRTKLFSLASGTLIVYILPATSSIQNIHIDYDKDSHVVLNDGAGFRLDLSEGFHGEASPRK